MARTALTPVAPTRAGVPLTLVAVDASASPNGNQFVTDGSEVLVIKNADTVSHTCTVQISPLAAPDGQTVSGRQITVAAGATVYAGSFGAEYRQADGNIYLNWDASTGMTVGVLNVV